MIIYVLVKLHYLSSSGSLQLYVSASLSATPQSDPRTCLSIRLRLELYLHDLSALSSVEVYTRIHNGYAISGFLLFKKELHELGYLRPIRPK